jgi:hypothetical protein
LFEAVTGKMLPLKIKDPLRQWHFLGQLGV